MTSHDAHTDLMTSHALKLTLCGPHIDCMTSHDPQTDLMTSHALKLTSCGPQIDCMTVHDSQTDLMTSHALNLTSCGPRIDCMTSHDPQTDRMTAHGLHTECDLPRPCQTDCPQTLFSIILGCVVLYNMSKHPNYCLCIRYACISNFRIFLPW